MQPPMIVGVALKKEKRKKHISDKLVAQAAAAGITLRFVDKEVPLEQQGPFVAILQKVRKPEWEQELIKYAAAHPEVQVFDLPAATYPIRNRGTMVSFMYGDGWQFEEPPQLVEPGRSAQRCRCTVPTNTTIAAGTHFEAAQRQMTGAGLRYPLLAKPLWADGREGSHALAVVHTPAGLQRLIDGEATYLQLPIMLQQYVDHGGCLFKVYVMADTSVRVKRNSLHLPLWMLQRQQPVQQSQQQQERTQQQAKQQQAQQAQQQQAQGAVGASVQPAQLQPSDLPDLELMERVSAYPASKSWGRADTAPKGHGVPSPPAWFLQALAQRLRQQTGLNLFNFDVIVPMHCHRRTLPHQVSCSGALAGAEQAQQHAQQQVGAIGVPTSGASIVAAAAQAVAEVDATGGQQPVGLAPLLPEEEEPVAVDLGAAAAAAAAAAEAAAAAAAAAAEAEAAAAGANGAAAHAQHAGALGPAAAAAAAAAQAAAAAAAADAQQQQQQQQQQQHGTDEVGRELLYHLIDINYFPGYEKMPNYEDYMVQFLRSVCYPQQQQQ